MNHKMVLPEMGWYYCGKNTSKSLEWKIRFENLISSYSIFVRLRAEKGFSALPIQEMTIFWWKYCHHAQNIVFAKERIWLLSKFCFCKGIGCTIHHCGCELVLRFKNSSACCTCFKGQHCTMGYSRTKCRVFLCTAVCSKIRWAPVRQMACMGWKYIPFQAFQQILASRLFAA